MTCAAVPVLGSRDSDETLTWEMRQSEGFILYQSPLRAAWIMLDYPSVGAWALSYFDYSYFPVEDDMDK